MLLQRWYFLITVCFQITFCLPQREASKNNNSTNVNDQQQGPNNESNTKQILNLKNNASTNIIQLNDKGRFLRVYDLVTCDGYILNVFRTTFGKNETKGDKFPVLLVHGLYQSSDRFLEQGNVHSLAFLLQDSGYDVWLANTRGNKYSRHHINLEPDIENVKFFSYSYEEIALNDISLMIDYILNDTSKQKMHYIGHSIGSTVFLVLNSLKPEYNNKISTAHLMAPIGYQSFFPNSDLTEEANRVDEIFGNLVKQGKAEIFPYVHNILDKNENASLPNVKFSVEDCFGDKNYQNICRKLKIDEFMDLRSDNNSINKTRGGSIKMLAHLAQNIKSKRFSRWDYGEKENEKQYGTKQSPEYDLSLITVATKIIYAANDEYVSPKDIADMAKDMANATTVEVTKNNFTHKDFIVAPDVMENIYSDIIKDLISVKNSNRITRDTKPKQNETKMEHGNDEKKEINEHEEHSEEDEEEEPEVVKKPGTNRNRKPAAKFRTKKRKLSIIPASWMIYIIFWVPKLLLPITICICLIMFFFCLKKVHYNLAVTLKNDKEDDQ